MTTSLYRYLRNGAGRTVAGAEALAAKKEESEEDGPIRTRGPVAPPPPAPADFANLQLLLSLPLDDALALVYAEAEVVEEHVAALDACKQACASAASAAAALRRFPPRGHSDAGGAKAGRECERTRHRDKVLTDIICAEVSFHNSPRTMNTIFTYLLSSRSRYVRRAQHVGVCSAAEIRRIIDACPHLVQASGRAAHDPILTLRGGSIPDAEMQAMRRAAQHVCRFYSKGWCRSGRRCRFLHV